MSLSQSLYCYWLFFVEFVDGQEAVFERIALDRETSSGIGVGLGTSTGVRRCTGRVAGRRWGRVVFAGGWRALVTSVTSRVAGELSVRERSRAWTLAEALWV